MDEILIALAWLLALTIVLGPSIATIVAIVRMRNMRRQLDELRERIDSIESREAPRPKAAPAVSTQGTPGAAIATAAESTAPRPTTPESPFDPTVLSDAPATEASASETESSEDARRLELPGDHDETLVVRELKSRRPPLVGETGAMQAAETAASDASHGADADTDLDAEAGDEAASPPTAAPRPRFAPQKIEWERWIGVRGAAVVGGSVLALAAILFFRHAFVQGWISHEMRVVGGLMLGAASILGAAFLRKRNYRVTPNALEGAGVVALYASIWAAQQRYHLISMAVSFPAMSAVTGLACYLSLRNRSLLTAVLGLLGGFATPILLSTGTDRPIALFGYILLLDLGLCFVAKRGRWPVIGALAMVGTLVMQGLWIFGPMQERLGLGLIISGLFALVFLFAGMRVEGKSRTGWLVSQVGSMLGAFVFAFYFATRTDVPLGQELWPTALLLALLNVMAGVIARLRASRDLPTGAAVASFFVATVWFFHAERSTIEPFWSVSLTALGLLAVPHVIARWFSPDPETVRENHRAAAVANGGWTLLLVVACASLRDLEPWAPTLGLIGLLAYWILQSHRLERSLAWIGGLGLGLGWNLTVTAGFFEAAFSLTELIGAGARMDERLVLALPAVFALLLVGWAFARGNAQDDKLAQALHHAALALLMGFIVLLPSEPSAYASHLPWLGPLAAIGYGAILAAASLGTRRALVLGLGLFVSGYLLHAWQRELLDEPRSEELLLQALVWVAAAPLALLSIPLLRANSYRRPWAPGLAAALFTTFIYLPAWPIFRARFGELNYAMGVEWFVFAIGAILALCVRGALADGADLDPRRRLGWILGASLLFLAGGIANLFDGVSEAAILFALFALGLAALGRRLRLAGPPYVALVSSSLAFANLFFTFLDDGRYPSSEAPVGAWISYFFLLPALCFFLVARLNSTGASHENKLRMWLARMTRLAPSLACIVSIFLWINLVVCDFYETTTRIRFFSERPPEQDLALSIAWGLYAVLLLSLGVWSKQSGLRWASLGLFVVTLGKVFLRDLGHLEGLYRVGSLTGLALALLFVSLFYQRFVFRAADVSGAGDGAGDAPGNA